MGLVDENNKLNFYDGKVRMVDPEGKEFVKFAPHEYLDVIEEHVEPWSYVKFPFLKKVGWRGFVGGMDSGIYRVGPLGRVIGVDITEEMVQLAKRNAEKMGVENVEFRLGEIENLPVEDGTVDVIISNCVINLSPNKDKVFSEAFRVLKPGGRMLISDIVTHGKLPSEIRESPEMWAACVAGALDENDYLQKIRNAGFEKVEVLAKNDFMGIVSSIRVRAYKPL